MHLTFANHHSPPQDVHALEQKGQLAENVAFSSVRENGELLGHPSQI